MRHTTDKRKRRRWRRARRRGRMPPSTATAISTRARGWGWMKTRSITRHHKLEWYWEDQFNYRRE